MRMRLVPQAGKGEVLIKVYAAGVNPVDLEIREGYLKQMRSFLMPLIPGWDVSGVIEELGPEPSGSRRAMKCIVRPDTGP